MLMLWISKRRTKRRVGEHPAAQATVRSCNDHQRSSIVTFPHNTPAAKHVRHTNRPNKVGQLISLHDVQPINITNPLAADPPN